MTTPPAADNSAAAHFPRDPAPSTDGRSEWPTASLASLQRRSDLTFAVHQFFRDRNYWLVDTPLLSRDTVVDLHLEPFAVHGNWGAGLTDATCYLQTSPEFAMKRLLAAGAERIYQVTHAFRQAERGRWHNPEFTMLEWYAVGEDHFAQMDCVEQLCGHLFETAEQASRLSRPFVRMTYEAAFEAVFGTGVLDLSWEELVRLAEQADVDGAGRSTAVDPSDLTELERKDDLLNLMLSERVEPWLARQGAVFLYDYPVSQAALARVSPRDSRVAERFELYLNGLEICNGYHELTDAHEFRQRTARQNQLRRGRGLPELPEHSRLVDAMSHGLPASSGVAVGLDRLLALAIGATELASVLAFPIERA